MTEPGECRFSAQDAAGHSYVIVAFHVRTSDSSRGSDPLRSLKKWQYKLADGRSVRRQSKSIYFVVDRDGSGDETLLTSDDKNRPA